MNAPTTEADESRVVDLLVESLDIQKSILRLLSSPIIADLNTQSKRIKLLAEDYGFSDTAIQAATGATYKNIDIALKRAGMR